MVEAAVALLVAPHSSAFGRGRWIQPWIATLMMFRHTHKSYPLVLKTWLAGQFPI